MTSRYLTINRFKCFETLNLRIENLTVLTGRNSVGKSTLTQALRLFKEVATTQQTKPVQIHLNGGGFQFGTLDEILNRNTSKNRKRSFEIGLSDTPNDNNLVSFEPAETSEECEYVQATPLKSTILGNISSWSFTYLSAERNGPRLHQESADGHRATKVGVGVKGEFTAEVLASNPTTRIDQKLIHPSLISIDSNKSNALLNSNLEKWMSTIVGDIGIRASRPPRLAMPMLEFSNIGAEAEWQFPTNYGFGVSYTLPIVLAGLLLEENGFLIVDTPEAHLHPAAQTAIAMFLAQVASCGRTVIVETHSDHIIDGFRLAVADPAQNLTANDCIFHYFDKLDSGAVVSHDLTPRPNGTLPKWPKGFFDQMSTNLRALAALANKNGT